MLKAIKPMDIEKCSFEIITRELGDRLLDPENELVVKRVIHTTADFDYVENLRFSAHAVGKGLEALRGGCGIVTDTQMARSGINKTILAQPWSPWSGPQTWRNRASSPSATRPPPSSPSRSLWTRDASLQRW